MSSASKAFAVADGNLRSRVLVSKAWRIVGAQNIGDFCRLSHGSAILGRYRYAEFAQKHGQDQYRGHNALRSFRVSSL